MTTLFHYNTSTLCNRFTNAITPRDSRRFPNKFLHRNTAQEIERQIILLERLIVPPKKRATNTQYGIQWVRVDLNASEKTDMIAWIQKGDYDLGELLALCLSDGEKVSFSYSQNQDAFYCTVMGSEHSARNEGKGFTSYAKNPFDALSSAMYKYHTLLEGSMGEAGGTGLLDDIG